MRRILLGIVLLSIIGGLAYWKSHRNRAPLDVAYAGEKKVTVWSSNAPVRSPLQVLTFGDKVSILRRSGENVEVKTPSGVDGWVTSHNLIPEDLWKGEITLTAQAQSKPVQAQARTKVLTNLRIEPGRDGVRILQLTRDVPLSVLGRRVMDARSSALPRPRPDAAGNAAAGAAPNADDDETDAGEPATTKKEDWLLVLAQVKDTGQLAGWVIARFVELDLPQAVRDYASSAGMRPVGWFELNKVRDPVTGLVPQFLIIGSRGPEGDPCDFTTMRAYTWGSKRARYETAFVESGFCGHMPVQVTPAKQPGGDADFRFEAVDLSGSGAQQRVYHLHQTMIRRVDTGRTKSRAKSR
jgi:hypothetical protein